MKIIYGERTYYFPKEVNQFVSDGNIMRIFYNLLVLYYRNNIKGGEEKISFKKAVYDNIDGITEKCFVNASSYCPDEEKILCYYEGLSADDKEKLHKRLLSYVIYSYKNQK